MARSQSLSPRDKKLKQRRSRGSWLIVILSGILTILVSLLLLLAVLPIVSPSASADMADMLRAVVGPEPVAVLESASFQLQDIFNQVRYQVRGGQPQIEFSNQLQNQVVSSPAPSTQTMVNDQNTLIPSSTQGSQSTPVPSSTPGILNTSVAGNNVVSDAPQLGWQAYGPDMQGSPVMSRALIMLDPKRSYTSIALVRIDVSRIQLHMMPGNIEPAHPSGISQAIPFLGMIPPVEQGQLIAAFNGGFKQVHGYYGMMTDGVTLLPPKPGIATLALYQDGRIRIGAWGSDIVQTPDLVAFRQNCPPLIEAGQVNPALYRNNRAAWGTTGNTDITWRTGLGITQDGRYLIYAVGNGTTAATLAEGLLKADSSSAMQLDIHQFYAHFYTYQTNTDPNTLAKYQLVGDPLLEEMVYNPYIYLIPSPRDFFYLTSH